MQGFNDSFAENYFEWQSGSVIRRNTCTKQWWIIFEAAWVRQNIVRRIISHTLHFATGIRNTSLNQKMEILFPLITFPNLIIHVQLKLIDELLFLSGKNWYANELWCAERISAKWDEAKFKRQGVVFAESTMRCEIDNNYLPDHTKGPNAQPWCTHLWVAAK